MYTHTRMVIKWGSAPKSPNEAMTFQALQHDFSTSNCHFGVLSVAGWWLTDPEKYEFVSWDDDIPKWKK